MIKKYTYYCLALALCIASVAVVHGRRYKNKPRCQDKENCLTNPSCQCYCSEKGDFRDKTNDDKPVYVENDKNGVYCYCKQWDLDVYPGPAERPANQETSQPIG